MRSQVLLSRTVSSRSEAMTKSASSAAAAHSLFPGVTSLQAWQVKSNVLFRQLPTFFFAGCPPVQGCRRLLMVGSAMGAVAAGLCVS